MQTNGHKIKITNSSYLAALGLYKHIKDLSHYINGKVLDVGCGNRPYEKLFNATNYIGMDIEGVHDHTNEKVDLYYDGKIFPISDNTYDSVISTQVLEHVQEPMSFLSEINRIMKPNAHLLLTVPFIWEEHEIPFDFTRFTSYGIKYNLEKLGFEIIEQKKSVSDLRAIFQLVNSYLVSLLPKKNKLVKFIITVFVTLNNILGIVLHHILPKKYYLYLDNVIVAKKITPNL